MHKHWDYWNYGKLEKRNVSYHEITTTILIKANSLHIHHDHNRIDPYTFSINGTIVHDINIYLTRRASHTIISSPLI